MRSFAGALWRALASFALLAGTSAPAHADLTAITNPTPIFSGPGTLFQAQVAFDEVNQVYLVVWGTFNAQPALGIVLNTLGQPISQVFAISDGQTRSGWARVSAGGGRFMVTYTKYVGGTDDRPVTAQMARFVTATSAGVPTIASAEIPLDSLGTGSSDAGTVYVPAQNAFLATWWKQVGIPQSFVRRVNVDGTLGPIHQLTDGSDGQSDPEIACDASGTCLAIGFAWDTAHAGPNQGATWSRLIDAASGAPVAPLRYIDVNNRQESQTITFSAIAGRYNAAWVRTYNRVIGQAVDTGGNPLGLYAIKNGTGGNGCDFGFGQISNSLTYNAGSGTMAIAMTDWCGHAYISELDGTGLPIAGQFHAISGLSTADNQPVVAANAASAQFLALHNYQYVSPRTRVYQAVSNGGGGGNPPPPPPPPVTIDLSPEGAPNGSWFMAEGVASPQPFNSYYLVANENPNAVTVRAYFADPDGKVKSTTFEVPARSRYTLDLGAVIGMGAYASVFQSLTPGQDVYVERSIYFGPNFEGSTVGTATKILNGTWYFAEGSRGGEYFANYFLLFNPTQAPITVNATFFPSSGAPVVRSFTIGPQARYTVSAADIGELANTDFSSTFTGSGQFVAERAMYWGNPWHGGTASMGAIGLSSRWLFAEGVANSLLETFYLILNPNDFPIEVSATYYPEYSESFTQSFTVEPKARYTVYLNGHVGQIGPTAAEFNSQASFLAERSIYWGGRVEGTNVIGVNAPAMVWSLPEGADGGMFDTYTLIANPSFTPVTLDITFFFDDGTQVTVPENLRPVVPARGRLTMDMGSHWLPLLESVEQRPLVGRSFSTRISVFQQTAPVVVEHALYWNFQPGTLWRSGGAAVGIPR